MTTDTKWIIGTGVALMASVLGSACRGDRGRGDAGR